MSKCTNFKMDKGILCLIVFYCYLLFLFVWELPLELYIPAHYINLMEVHSKKC